MALPPGVAPGFAYRTGSGGWQGPNAGALNAAGDGTRQSGGGSGGGGSSPYNFQESDEYFNPAFEDPGQAPLDRSMYSTQMYSPGPAAPVILDDQDLEEQSIDLSMLRGGQYQADPYSYDAFAPGAEFQQRLTARQFTDPSAAGLEEDPGYQFRRREGSRALESGAAASGALNTGGTLRALTRFNQDLASQEYAAAADRGARRFQINQGERFGTFDRNLGAHMAGRSQRRADAQAGFDISSGVYDRNRTGQLQDREFDYRTRTGEFDRNLASRFGRFDRLAGQFTGNRAARMAAHDRDTEERRGAYDRNAAERRFAVEHGRQGGIDAWDRDFLDRNFRFQQHQDQANRRRGLRSDDILASLRTEGL